MGHRAEGRRGKAEGGKKKVRSWEDEKVSRAQSAWGIGLKADVGRRKVEK